MSANNRRIRRIIVDMLWEHGPMVKEGVAQLLAENKTIRTVPSPHSLSSLLCKNVQVRQVGREKVENAIGNQSYHAIYDIDRFLIRSEDNIIQTRTTTVMTPAEKKRAKKCEPCGRVRVFPDNSTVCLHCIRESEAEQGTPP